MKRLLLLLSLFLLCLLPLSYAQESAPAGAGAGAGVCADDVAKFCSSAADKSKKEIRTCLKQHVHELSPDCQAKQNMKKAKQQMRGHKDKKKGCKCKSECDGNCPNKPAQAEEKKSETN
ncbi:MAG: hypothetical protein HQK52_13750 [Oligoflexia bacterium]|nr:hypothetical protein [Oligoflexia bacterium]